MKNCLFCGKQMCNPKFCNRSCAASFNNKKTPKRKPEHKCLDCDTLISAKRARCRKHYLIWLKQKEAKDMTLNEAIYKKHHRSSAYALIRTRARSISKKLGFNKCVNCGYDKHIEIAHIKPISAFTGDILISEINSIKNIIPLCPNCHWEFDNKLLKIKL